VIGELACWGVCGHGDPLRRFEREEGDVVGFCVLRHVERQVVHRGSGTAGEEKDVLGSGRRGQDGLADTPADDLDRRVGQGL